MKLTAINPWALSMQPLADMVRQTGGWLRASWAATGLGLAIAWFAGMLLLATLLDLVWPFGTAVRWAALLLATGPGVLLFAAGFVAPLARRLPPQRVARRIEGRIPQIQNRLVSCVDLMHNGAHEYYSQAFLQRLIDETKERVAGFEPVSVVDRGRVRRALALAGAALVALAVAWWLLPVALPTALARIFLPWADIPPASRTVFTVLPGDATLLRGDDITITAQIERGDPGQLRLELRDDNGGRPLTYDLAQQDAQRWSFTLTGYERSFQYRVIGDGTWSRRYRIRLLERPAIVSLHTVLHFPAYMGDIPPATGQPQVMDVTGPEGAEVEVVAEVRGQVAVGEIQRLDAPTNSQVLATMPLQVLSNGTWAGKFLLTSNGYYRVAFRNELGYANKNMNPGRFVALADQPPQVTLERPGSDLVLSQAGKLPLVIAASDDFGLEAIYLGVQRRDGAPFQPTPVKRFAGVQPSDAVVTTLDLAALQLKAGESIRYRAEVLDRKGQRSQTREFLVRIAAEAQAIDRQLEQFLQQQDAAAMMLGQLVASQAVVRAELSGLAVRYEPVLERLEETVAEVRLAPEMLAESANAAAATNALATAVLARLDPETARLLAALRQQMGELATLEQQNAARAQEIAAQWAQAAQQAAVLPMMPVEMADQMRLLQQTFQQAGVWPMQDLASALQQSAAPNQLPPDLGQLQQVSERMQAELAGLTNRLAEFAGAARQLQQDPDRAVAELRAQTLRSQAGLMAHELRNLADTLAAMAGEMERLQGQGTDLLEDRDATEPQLAALGEQVEPWLNASRHLLTSGRMRGLRDRQPVFPEEPFVPDHGEYLLPPAEEDTAEPDPNAVDGAVDDPSPRDRAAAADEEGTGTEEELFMPVLGGPRPELNPRFANKIRPVARRPAVDGADQGREEARAREWQRLSELDLAQQSLAADQQAAAQLARQMEQAARSRGQSPAQTAAAMQSSTLRQAMDMAARMQQMGANNPRGQLSRQPSWLAGFSAAGGGRVHSGPMPLATDVPALDVNTRAVILNLQPQLREALLQGMSEEGPAAYRKFIQSYFQQLTKVKGP